MLQAGKQAAPAAPAEAEGWEAHSAWNDVDGWADEVEPDLEADLEAALPSTPLAGACAATLLSIRLSRQHVLVHVLHQCCWSSMAKTRSLALGGVYCGSMPGSCVQAPPHQQTLAR